MADLSQEITQFAADFTGINPEKISRDSTLFGDLAVDGSDGWEFVEEFGKRFDVDLFAFPEAGKERITRGKIRSDSDSCE